ncbi:hypothetical protein BGZ60DRAFT_423962 [Tricladium varicosporioides]|nr:hypothetical protein BGZ60DRAFT_423962 [Hymenoscyphus varicosporioides]
MSANETNESKNTWSVRASLTTGLVAGGTTTVTNLQCELVKNGNWMPPVMPSNDTLTEWVPATFGYLMNNKPDSFPADLELKLNAMSMISGSGNYDLYPLKKLPSSESAFYGCLLKRTALDPAIWGVLGLVFAILLSVATGATMMMISHGIRTKNSQDGQQLIHDTPSGVDDWQVALLKEYIHDEDISMNQAKDYSFGWDSDKQTFIFAKNDHFKNNALASAATELHSLKQGATNETPKARSFV